MSTPTGTKKQDPDFGDGFFVGRRQQSGDPESALVWCEPGRNDGIPVSSPTGVLYPSDDSWVFVAYETDFTEPQSSDPRHTFESFEDAISGVIEYYKDWRYYSV